MPLRLVFMGTPDFALPTLATLIDAGHDIACVYSQPPRPAGRGHRLRLSPVQALAEDRGLEVRTPLTLRDEAAAAEFRALQADAAVVVAYGLILPQPILAAPRLGCLNVHASLLPRWRGAAPIQRAILAGDAETGVAVMLMEEGLDTGPVLAEQRVPIGPRATAGELADELAAIGARLMAASLDGLAAGTLAPRPQAETGVTYARKIDKEEGRLDWSRPAVELDRLVRAFAPAPGAFFEHEGERIRVLEAEPVAGPPAARPPGTVIGDGLAVACGAGALRLLVLQRAGRGPLDAAAFLRGHRLPPGTRLG